jgi:sugar phosphate isomerase/epimerase
MQALIASVKELAAYGQARGVALTCETFDRTVDKKCLIGPSPAAAEFARAVRQDFPTFGLLYDLSHQPLLFEQSEAALTLLKDYLVHIHVGNGVVDPNAKSYGDTHPRFGWPGGCNDVPELVTFIRALFKVGYLGNGKAERPWVGFEVKPQSADECSEYVIAGTKRVWEEAWALA